MKKPSKKAKMTIDDIDEDDDDDDTDAEVCLLSPDVCVCVT